MGSATREFAVSRDPTVNQIITMDEAKEKFFQCHDDTKTAFEELCAMVDALNSEREKRGLAIARFEAMKAWNAHLREKNQRLRAKYIAVVDMYNTLAEEAKERSDSSSSSDEEQDDNCCIM